MKASIPALLTALVALFTTVLADERASSESPPAGIKVATKRADDTVSVRAENARTLLIVHSPFGISQAVLERLGSTWPPETVVLQLHLKGLEHFQVSNGRVKLDAAVAVEEGKTSSRQWKDGDEAAPLDKTSPLWMEIRFVAGESSANRPDQESPLQHGYFELTLPGAIFENGPKAITLDWIDFYRQ